MRSLRIVLILAAKELRILSRMPGILAVIFVPGIVMYAVFTKIFEGPAGRPFRVAVIDQDGTAESGKLIEALTKSNVSVIRTEDEAEDGPPLTVETARRQIRKRGKYRVALVIPEGYGRAPNIKSGDRHEGVRLIFDESQQMEANAVAGMLQMAAGRRLFESTLGMLGGDARGSSAKNGDDGLRMLIKVEKEGVAIRRKKIAAKHTFMAGIVTMFLLFGATGAARGVIEQIDSGEIARLRVAPISAGHIIGGNAVSVIVTGMMQCYSMFLFAWLVFDVEIWSESFGYRLFVLTLITCMATTSFGMLLGSLCRTTQQLDALGTVAILAMSAIGGSMVPRWVMPPVMQKIGLFTINGWANDGFMALTWGEPLLPGRVDGVFEWGVFDECCVLLAIAAGCFCIASKLMSRRLQSAPAA